MKKKEKEVPIFSALWIRLVLLSTLAAALLWTSAAVVCANQTAASARGSASSVDPTSFCERLVPFERNDFPRPTKIDNTWLPLVPGTRLTLEGRANRGGGPLPHRVVFTITDLTKVIDGVRTLVIWDVDRNQGQLAEAELSFFAQDKARNVWNLGEYPEEYGGGRFIGAPNTWIAGLRGAEGGIHMPAKPMVDTPYYIQGFAPDIGFFDCAKRIRRNPRVCVPVACYDNVVTTHEKSPLDPAGGVQRKFHAPGVGIVQVGAVNDPEGETLVLVKRERLGQAALAEARKEALKLDRHGYQVSDVYRQTPTAR